MNTSYMNLDKILDLKKWKKLQDSLSIVTKLAIITVDYKGTPITHHSDVRPFCKMMRDNPNTAKLCEKCDARGALWKLSEQMLLISIYVIGILSTCLPSRLLLMINM